MNKIVFSYRGLDQQGAEAQGTVEAADKDDALKQLRLLEAQGLHDLSIEGVQQLNGDPQAASVETTRRFCGSCGKENPAQHRFCAGCGKPLGAAVQVQSAAQTVTKQGRKQADLPLWHPLWLVNRLEAALAGPQTPSQRAERELEQRLRQGYIITYKDEERVQLVKKKKFSFLWAFLGLCFFVFGLLVYLLYYLAKSDQVVTIRLK